MLRESRKQAFRLQEPLQLGELAMAADLRNALHNLLRKGTMTTFIDPLAPPSLSEFLSETAGMVKERIKKIDAELEEVKRENIREITAKLQATVRLARK